MIKAAAKISCAIIAGTFLSSCAEMACFDPSPGYNVDCARARADSANERYRKRFAQDWAYDQARLDEQARQAQAKLAQKRIAAEKAQPFVRRGQEYLETGDYERAIVEFDNAIGVDPGSAWAYASRGEAHYRLGQHQRALTDLGRAIQFAPNYAPAYRLRGDLYWAQGKYTEALGDYDQAITRDAKDDIARNTKAWILATSPWKNVRNGREAVRLAREAINISDHAEYRDTLAAAHAENGQFSKAIKEANRAIDMLHAAGNLSLISEIESHLRLFEQRKPYRGSIF